jgi:hypothetical protein
VRDASAMDGLAVSAETDIDAPDELVVEPGPVESVYRALRYTDSAVKAARCLPYTHAAREALDVAVAALHTARRALDAA